MPASCVADLIEAFGLTTRRAIYLIGAGGKTSLMFGLAHELAAGGRSVVTTTSTRIGYPSSAQCRAVLVGGDLDRLGPRLRVELRKHRHVTVVAPGPAADKVGGFGIAALDCLVESGVCDHLLVEADGAAGRSLKAHAAHEPVVSARADLVIAVIGVDCLGKPITGDYVHRAELFCRRHERRADDLVTPADVAATFFHDEGYLAKVGKDTAVAVLINKVDGEPQAAGARAIEAALRAADREGRIGVIARGALGLRQACGTPLAPRGSESSSSCGR